jgi:hypothetical protein
MTDTEIIEALRNRINVPAGRHLYGVLGTYARLERFSKTIQQARTIGGQPFPAPLSVNREILEAIPDEEFKELAENETKWPLPTMQHVKQSFEAFLRSSLRDHDLLVLSGLEMLFAYNIELNLLRTLATDDKHIILLLPGKRDRQGNVTMFPGLVQQTYILPTNFIAENHLWELMN